ncbi:MAG: tetratricopeptide repeat protein [Cyclobacteriaceae bacterium]|nr:tetratricopeptide repeat protein [Cyclobacteriaceae bacterium]
MKVWAIILLLVMPAMTQAQIYQKRLALVIGNSTYEHGGSLPNPVNDANAIAVALQSVGFEVMKYQDLTQKEMKIAINSFGQKLKGYEVGVFYYAGHGIQSKGMNYMIPVEADLQTEEQVEFDCVAADRVLAYMDVAQIKVNVIIMDACRNNPFERSWHRSANGNGLAIMNAPTGTLIAYATAPGRVASDGAGSNGLYTSALLKYLNDPKLTIEQVFKKVRTEVTEKSQGAQVPWETTSLTGDDFYFAMTDLKQGTLVTSTLPATEKPSKSVSTRSVNEETRKKAIAIIDQGHDAYSEKNYSKAIEYYTNALTINPFSDDAYYWRGSSKFAQANYTDAIMDYNQATEINPNKEEAYYYRAMANHNLEAFQEALIDYDKAIELNPDVATMYYWRGQSKYKLARYEDAILDFSKSLQLNKNDGYSYGGRGNSYYMLAKYKEARIDYTKAIELLPNEAADYTYWRGIASYYSGVYSEALDDFIEYLVKDPNDSYSLLMTAHCHYMLKNYEQAIQYYSRSITSKPDYAEALYWRGNVYLILGKKSEAKRDVEQAISLDPKNETYLSFKAANFK